MSESKVIRTTFACSPLKNTSIPTSVLRIILCKGEVYRLPCAKQQIRILSGIAWATMVGKDIILTRGDKMHFNSTDQVVISSEGDHPLVLEISRNDMEKSRIPWIHRILSGKNEKN